MISTLTRSPILLIGAAHSGKSELAPQFLAPDRPALVIATADPHEPSLIPRIRELQSWRPAAWDTLETRHDLAAVVADACERYDQILIDSVNLWLASACVIESNAFHEEETQNRLYTQVDEMIRLLHDRPGVRAVVVSAEVAASLPSSRTMERCLRRIISITNQRLALACATIIEVKAGIPVMLRGS